MKNKLYTSLSFYLFFLITFTSTSTFAYVFSTSGGDRITLEQNDSGDHLVWISGCSFEQGSQGEIDSLLAMANWNNPHHSEPVFRGEWVSCEDSAYWGRWSRNHQSGPNNFGEVYNSQIVVSDHLQGKVIGRHRRTTDFSTKKAVSFTLFIRPPYVAGEFTCDSNRGSSFKMTLTHELGHALGLRHTQATRWASMRAGLPNGYYCDIHADQTLADIHPDDSSALNSAYPAFDLISTPWSDPLGYTYVPRTYYDLAALAYENEDDGDGTSTISRADPADNRNKRYCPGDSIPNVEFSVANLGTEKLKYTRTFWSSQTSDLSGPRSPLFSHSNRTKSPGAKNGIFQGQKDLNFSDSDLPPLGETWFLVMELDNITDKYGNTVSEDRSENNGMVHSVKVRRDPSCP